MKYLTKIKNSVYKSSISFTINKLKILFNEKKNKMININKITKINNNKTNQQNSFHIYYIHFSIHSSYYSVHEYMLKTSFFFPRKLNNTLLLRNFIQNFLEYSFYKKSLIPKWNRDRNHY